MSDQEETINDVSSAPSTPNATPSSDLSLASQSTPLFSLAGQIVQAKCVSVYDGDTANFVFKLCPGASLCRFRCRMADYNCAEIRGASEEERTSAKTAKQALGALILDKLVTLRLGTFDKYGRILVRVTCDGVNVNEEMLKYGKPYTGRGLKQW
jgi:endonuclease YncB( thermonuclease family)